MAPSDEPLEFPMWNLEVRHVGIYIGLWKTGCRAKRWDNVRQRYIQSVSRLVDITAGGDFLGLCDQKRSYKHASDFGRLRCYGYFLIPVHALVWTASYGTSWRVMYSAWWLIVFGSCNEQLAQFTTERQPVLQPAVAFSKTSF